MKYEDISVNGVLRAVKLLVPTYDPVCAYDYDKMKLYWPKKAPKIPTRDEIALKYINEVLPIEIIEAAQKAIDDNIAKVNRSLSAILSGDIDVTIQSTVIRFQADNDSTLSMISALGNWDDFESLCINNGFQSAVWRDNANSMIQITSDDMKSLIGSIYSRNTNATLLSFTAKDKLRKGLPLTDSEIELFNLNQ